MMPATFYVLVAHNAKTNAYGKVFHKPTCGVLARTFGTKQEQIEQAEDHGRTPCAFCHKTSNKRWICPSQAAGHKPDSRLRLAVRKEHTVLSCPTCGFMIVQAEDKT